MESRLGVLGLEETRETGSARGAPGSESYEVCLESSLGEGSTGSRGAWVRSLLGTF